MEQDEIIEMADECGLAGYFELDGDSVGILMVTTFAKLVDVKATAKEREACAMVAQKTVCDTHIPTGVRIYGTAAAKAIRARGTEA